MFDFLSEERKVVTSPPRTGPELVVTDVADLFARGIMLEENPSTQSEAIAVYLKVLDMDPMHAAAHINLGTLYYNRQEYALAERHYRSAIQIDPRYALAYFDLGNVLDETGRVEEAIEHLQDGDSTRAHLRRRALQHRAGLREDARTPQGAATLALPT